MCVFGLSGWRFALSLVNVEEKLGCANVSLVFIFIRYEFCDRFLFYQ